MEYQSVAKIDRLHTELQQRLERLIQAMQGGEPKHIPDHLYGPQRLVSGEAVRLAVDDFATVLKEIKASMGKR